MQTILSENELTAMNGKLRLFSLYGDFPASMRARWAASTIAKLAGPHWQTTSEMWKVDTLKNNGPIKDMITNDAANADMVIIASSSLAPSEPVLYQWLNSFEARKNNRPVTGLLVGLLGDEETTPMELASVVKPLLQCAQQMGWNFIWHRMGEDRMNDTDWLTTHLENLLVSKLAANSMAACC